MDSSRAFLGKGFAFPPEVDPVTGHFRMAGGRRYPPGHLYYSDDKAEGAGNAAGIRMQSAGIYF